MIRRPPRSTRTDTLFPTRRSSDLPMDYIRALGDAYEAEQGPAAKDAIAQILTNSRMCAEGHRPICQDTGIVTVFVEVGMDVRSEEHTSELQSLMRISYAVFCLKKKKQHKNTTTDLSSTYNQ